MRIGAIQQWGGVLFDQIHSKNIEEAYTYLKRVTGKSGGTHTDKDIAASIKKTQQAFNMRRLVQTSKGIGTATKITIFTPYKSSFTLRLKDMECDTSSKFKLSLKSV